MEERLQGGELLGLNRTYGCRVPVRFGGPITKSMTRYNYEELLDKCSPVTGKGAEPLNNLRPNNLIART